MEYLVHLILQCQASIYLPLEIYFVTLAILLVVKIFFRVGISFYVLNFLVIVFVVMLNVATAVNCTSAITFGPDSMAIWLFRSLYPASAFLVLDILAIIIGYFH